eukprot:TRINITY_DN992_c0_g1_i4.p1 TRINITY_DN992_c0_g1~~TRINITY_DN992_c0_g1_i4.p1  ORF type:complete len:290 (-),score=88.15 TRINITY_DN992_c0_g1_i4:21-890(-)
MDEQQRESMEKDRMHEKLERYLAAEIEGHTCPICFELMVPPINAPMLLFPCGHTFCDACLKRHEMERQRFLCPYCRAKIVSKAVNVSLQQLIENFVEKRDKIAQGVDPIGDDEKGRSSSKRTHLSSSSSSLPYGSRTNPHNSHSLSGGGYILSGVDADDEKDMESQYARQYRTYSVRCEVLQNEQSDTQRELDELKKKMEGGEKVISILLEEEKNALARLQAAEMEVKLVRSRIHDQRVKLHGMEEKYEDAKGCLDVVREVYGNLQRERDKAKFILMELQGKEILDDEF